MCHMCRMHVAHHQGSGVGAHQIQAEQSSCSTHQADHMYKDGQLEKKKKRDGSH